MVRHIADIAEIVEDIEAAISFYRDVLGLPVQHEQGDNYATVEVAGVLHFGIWSRQGAAKAVLGDPGAAQRIPLGFTVGFEVDAVDAASQTIQDRGWRIVQAPRKESWGQTTSRLLSPSGALCEVSETPWARRIIQPMQVQSEAE